MASKDIQLISGTQWNPKIPAILVVTTSSSYPEEGRVDISIGIALRRYAVPRGWFVKTEFYIACTGVSVQVWAKAGNLSFFEFTRSSLVKVEYELKLTESKGAEFAPKLAGKSEGGEISAELGKAQRSDTIERVAKFSMFEAPLSANQSANGVIEWFIDRPRVESIVRDFLEGRTDLQASGRWSGSQSPIICVSARPRDRRAFGPDLRELSLLWSIGLMAKLNFRGKLPPVDEVEQEIQIPSER